MNDRQLDSGYGFVFNETLSSYFSTAITNKAPAEKAINTRSHFNISSGCINLIPAHTN